MMLDFHGIVWNGAAAMVLVSGPSRAQFTTTSLSWSGCRFLGRGSPRSHKVPPNLCTRAWQERLSLGGDHFFLPSCWPCGWVFIDLQSKKTGFWISCAKRDRLDV